MSAQPQYTGATSQVPQHDGGIGQGPNVQQTASHLDIVCGPLLNYRRQTGDQTWHGSVLLVTKPSSPQPSLRISSEGAFGSHSGSSAPQISPPQAVKLYEDEDKTFWRFLLDLPFLDYEAVWTYTVSPIADNESSRRFVVPSKTQSMRIMFHSCNGFSVGTDVDAWSGPALWNDVLRMHQEQPFHVMIGGGDQIYNDSVRVTGPLKPWTDISNPKKRRDYPFGADMRDKCDLFYFDNYVKWYSTEPFKSANAIIPQINLWDDHDIIDGFGSYTDHFMRCAVFRGIGGVAHK